MKMHFRSAGFFVLLGALLTIALYLPGSHGPWLVDDDANLGIFKDYATGTAPYREIIRNNHSGPLGRPVAMASFAANHAFGLFSTQDLKITNILIHAGNGLLVYLLLARLLTWRGAGTRLKPRTLAALVAVWWLLLPMQISAVLYIVQRMTLLASTFALGCMLAYAEGRRSMLAGARHRGIGLITVALLVLLPLGALTKESALLTPVWIILIELFFFSRPSAKQLPRILAGLVVVAMLLAVAVVLLLPVRDGYVGRDFSMSERLLTETRVLWSYVRDIFLPDSAQMGLMHDDYPVSHSLLRPWTTLAAASAMVVTLAASLRAAATRWWAISFGILFYLAGHLLESTVVALELYFEHRNYLPSVGLLLAAAVFLTEMLPLRRRLLATVLALYLGLIAFATLQRVQIWGDAQLLIATSALNHPHSTRAWTDYAEEMVMEKRGADALRVDLQAAANNPDASGIFLMQMVSIYCRSNQMPPPALVEQMAAGIRRLPTDMPSLLTPLSIGLDYLLTSQKEGHCGGADFSPLATVLVARDAAIGQRFGEQRKSQWMLRLTMAEWLLALGNRDDALRLLRDIWRQDNRTDTPTVGMTLAQTLDRPAERHELRQVLEQLAAVTPDAPADFRAEMTTLQARLQDTP
jgi:hypothetical protein